MIEQTTKSSDLTPALERPKVWIYTYEHRYGTDVGACETEDLAYRQLAAICREYWEEAREVADALVLCEDEEPFPAQPPTEDRAAVQLYFSVRNQARYPETYEIEAHAVVGIEERGRR